MKKKRLIKVEIEDINRVIQLAYPGKQYLPVVKHITVLNDVHYYDIEDFLLYPDTVLPDDIYDYIATTYEKEIKKSKRNEQRRIN